jgi:hypothetical protein
MERFHYFRSDLKPKSTEIFFFTRQGRINSSARILETPIPQPKPYNGLTDQVAQ